MGPPTTTKLDDDNDDDQVVASREPSLWSKLKYNASESWYKLEEGVEVMQSTASVMWDAMKFRSDSYETAARAQSLDERRRKLKSLDVSVWDFVDPSKPWQLVESGSLLGYFDWVPIKLRKGPWMSVAPAMLFMMVYLVAVGNIFAYNQGVGWMDASGDDKNFWARLKRPSPEEAPYRMGLPEISGDHHYESDMDVSEYPQYEEPLWYYNAVASIWMAFISVGVLRGPGGINAWATYSMWSWQILHNRHILITLAPFIGYNNVVVAVLELTRLPALIMTSMTFFMWNFVLMPFIYFFFMENQEKRANFLAYFTRFRLLQLHVFNVGFAYMNGVLSSPSRTLTLADFMASMTIAIVYILWYLLVLDRIGVHVYPIFSPRSPWMVVTWAFMVISYIGAYYFWKEMIMPR